MRFTMKFSSSQNLEIFQELKFLSRLSSEMDRGLHLGKKADGTLADWKLGQKLRKNFVEVQMLLDQNRLLINESSKNQELASSDGWKKNVGLIRKLNSNIQDVTKLYGDILRNVSTGSSYKGDSSGAPKSNGKHGKKKINCVVR